MTEEEFSELSAKVLTDEATKEEELRHRSACEANLDFKDSFQEMKLASGLIGVNAPLAAAMDAKEPEIPEFLLEQLVDEVSQKETLSSSASDTVKDSNILNLWVKLTLPVAAVLAIAFFINQGDSPTTQNLLNPAADSVEIASLEVEFGRWKDQVVRGGVNTNDWVPDSIGKSYFENKTERNDWAKSSADKIRIWIDEDEAKIMILRPGQKEAIQLNLQLDPDKQRSQLVELMNALSFPKDGILHKVLEADTLSSIAEIHESTVDWIVNANGLDPENPLVPDSKIFVPKSD